MSDKMHNILRLLQWLIPALVTLYGVFDKVFGWGLIGDVETIASAIVAFIGVVAQHSSKVYFDTRDIIDKVVPDTEDE
jgi:hypothetical protein